MFNWNLLEDVRKIVQRLTKVGHFWPFLADLGHIFAKNSIFLREIANISGKKIMFITYILIGFDENFNKNLIFALISPKCQPDPQNKTTVPLKSMFVGKS